MRTSSVLSAKVLLVALCVGLAASPSTASEVASLSGAGCLDVSLGDPQGGGGAGRNVIVWPECHEQPNQDWTFVNGQITSTIDGKTYCLDIDMADSEGAAGRGRNVVAWPECHGGENQRWAWVNGQLIATVRGQSWCLDVNVQASSGGEGRGRVVQAWPECHGASNQSWVVR